MSQPSSERSLDQQASSQPVDPAVSLLRKREVQALKVMTVVRAAMIALLSPLVWLLGASVFDRVATYGLILLYAIALVMMMRLLRKERYLTGVGLTGCALDVMLIAALPAIWYVALGAGDMPVGMTLKTSVTLYSLLLIALNTLALRPMFPLLVTAGTLVVHLVLIALSWFDANTLFTGSYRLAYTSSELASGTVVTRIVVLILVGAILTLLTVQTRRMIIETSNLQKTNVQLSRYFSPNLVSRLANNPALLELGGERKDVSFVFTDLQGFTSLVEANDASVIVPLLNDYLDVLVQIAFKYDGTVDKIVGDAVHVIFGAPVDQTDHADRAIACALEMDRVAEDFRATSGRGLALGVTRIGVNSGAAIVGNFGGKALFDYTAHGDAINTAARLEAANKYLHTRVCVSAETVKRARHFSGRPVGTLSLPGKRHGVDVFEPLEKDAPGQDSQALEAYLLAYDKMREGRADAREAFHAYCAQYPEDRLARLHRRRLERGESGVLITVDAK